MSLGHDLVSTVVRLYIIKVLTHIVDLILIDIFQWAVPHLTFGIDSTQQLYTTHLGLDRLRTLSDCTAACFLLVLELLGQDAVSWTSPCDHKNLKNGSQIKDFGETILLFLWSYS